MMMMMARRAAAAQQAKAKGAAPTDAIASAYSRQEVIGVVNAMNIQDIEIATRCWPRAQHGKSRVVNDIYVDVVVCRNENRPGARTFVFR